LKVQVWAATSLVASSLLGVLMVRPDALEWMPIPLERTVFLPGATTDGHYQIELDCGACHAEPFADVATMQAACVRCHGAELERVDDSHPQRKFTDPRNAERVSSLDARWCVTCHREHRPEITSGMGLSLPVDYCYRCHENVGDERPTHAQLPFESCASGGCHNFHDNQALYEDFLVEHRDEPVMVPGGRVPVRALLPWAREQALASGEPLRAEDHDAPAERAGLEREIAEWAGTAHAQAGVNCGGCHAPDGAAWTDRPALVACRGCHELESEGFLAGRHGMRLAAGLAPMSPRQARLPMRAQAADLEIGCDSCHPAHAYDTRFAAVRACLACHADEHSLAFEGSPHAASFEAETSGRAEPGSGVSCATCHLPRVALASLPARPLVAHNQNDTLRPNEKMIRSSCLHCHGLGTSLSSLADPALVRRNFRGRPAREVESIHYATVLRFALEGRPPPFQEAEAEQEEEKEIER
jgi:hypothetical protein